MGSVFGRAKKLSPEKIIVQLNTAVVKGAHPSAELNVVDIYDTLQEVKLDADDNVVIDQDALASLYETMNY